MILYNSSAGRKVESFQYSQSYTRSAGGHGTHFASFAVFRLVETQGAPRVHARSTCAVV